MQGPPSSAAGPSQDGRHHEDTPQGPSVSLDTQCYPSRPVPTASPHIVNSVQNASYVNVAASQTASYPVQHQEHYNIPYTYYNYPPNAWGNAWSTGYPYQYGYSQSQIPPQRDASQSNHTASTQPSNKPDAPPLSSSSPPPFHKHWDTVISSFLSSAGLIQALRGFEADMVVMNSDWEMHEIPVALGELTTDLLRITRDDVNKSDDSVDSVQTKEPLSQRKLSYVNLAHGAEPRSQTSITKSISRFLAQTRARNDASNRNEFLQSLSEKRRRLDEAGDSEVSPPIPSCARTDAKMQDRDIQMKYDIAKNEDGPLRRTLSSNIRPSQSTQQGNGAPTLSDSSDHTPALDERIRNIESHFAIRYVPSPPKYMLDRLRFLEDHIIQLEKDYPPWAALHFNQPNRGWPPPPRPTPIIVPSHLTSTDAHESRPTLASALTQDTPVSATATPALPITQAAESNELNPARGKSKSSRNTSSLHRAVMEKLEVQKAMHDLAGVGDSG